jgi:hypothetical protein
MQYNIKHAVYSVVAIAAASVTTYVGDVGTIHVYAETKHCCWLAASFSTSEVIDSSTLMLTSNTLQHCLRRLTKQYHLQHVVTFS